MSGTTKLNQLLRSPDLRERYEDEERTSALSQLIALTICKMADNPADVFEPDLDTDGHIPLAMRVARRCKLLSRWEENAVEMARLEEQHYYRITGSQRILLDLGKAKRAK